MPTQDTPIIIKRHTDSNGNFTTNNIVGEVKQVVKRHVLLEEIPHPHLGLVVAIEEDNTILKEVHHSEKIEEREEFKVDYSEGKIWVHESIEGKKLKIDYWGTGYDMIHVNRVYTQLDINGDVTETLGDILDYALVIIQELGEIKDAVIRGEIIIENLISECDKALELLSSLGVSIAEGSELDLVLKATIEKAIEQKTDLEALLFYADEKIAELNALNAEVGEMIDISNNYHLLAVKNDLQSKIDIINNVLEELQNQGATHDHDTRYLRLDGLVEMEAGFKLSNGKIVENQQYGLDANNSDIVNINSLYIGEHKITVSKDGNLSFNDEDIWTNVNQGENSNLDADLLDGKHSSDFIQATDINGILGMATNDSDLGYVRTTVGGLLPHSNGSSSLGKSDYVFLNAYIKNILGCNNIQLQKVGTTSKIEFKSTNTNKEAHIEHELIGENSLMKMSVGKLVDYRNGFQVGQTVDGRYIPFFKTQGDGVTTVDQLSIGGKKLFIQTTTPTGATEGSIWFKV